MPTTTLAINGGTPVRTKPLPLPYLGTSVMGKEELALLADVIDRQSPFREYGAHEPHMVKDFEQALRAYFGVPYALATATGSASFYCAMAGLGLGPGDEVIIPAFGWYTAFEAPVLVGATPVFADIDRSLNLDIDDVARKITPRTRAVIVIHFQGATNDMDRLLAVARQHNIAFVEDCAQACGTLYKGRRVGTMGDVAGFSMQQNKIISTGDGGFLLSSDTRIFERAVRFHDLGLTRPSLVEQMGGETQEEPFSGCQFRMNEFTGAVALAQLRKIDSVILNHTRRHHVRLRKIVTAECPGMVFRQVGDVEGDAGIAFYMDLGTPERGGWFGQALAAEGIRVGPSSGCINLLHKPVIQGRRTVHPALPPFGPGWPGEHVRYAPEQCPNTDGILASMVCVALVPLMTDADIDDIATAIAKVWHGRPPGLFS